jgi:AcrR family transcriptional regulator
MRKTMPRTGEAHQRIREERKEQLLDAASLVFARKELTGMRIADIAAERKMSQDLIFPSFASKEEVFVGVGEKALPSRAGCLTATWFAAGKMALAFADHRRGMGRKPDDCLVLQRAQQ